MLPIRSADFSPSLQRLAEQISVALQPPCIGGTVANKPDATDPDCTVVSHTSNGLGGFVDATVPSCASNGGAAPCWRLTSGACAGGGNGQIVNLSADISLPTTTAQNATVNCALCTPGVSNPARGCP